MRLLDELKALRAIRMAAPPPEPYEHQQETADELFDLVLEACRDRAESGCSTLSFQWAYVFTDDRQEWEEQHEVCLEVTQRLQGGGLKASCNDVFPEPYYNAYDELENPDGFHFIAVNWH